MSLKGNPSSLRKFADSLRTLPRVVAQKVCAAAAPAITELAQETFDAGENAYGLTWAPSVDGHRVTLRKTGDLARHVIYVAIGTRLRVVLGVPYAKYQIGKRPIYPSQGAGLPPAYVETLSRVTAEVARAELGGGP